MDALKDLLRRHTIKLPSPPSIALRLLEVVKKDDFSFTEVAEIIPMRSGPHGKGA